MLVRLGDVEQPQQLTVFTSRDGTPGNIVRMEVYTGRLAVNFHSNTDRVEPGRFISLLPIDAQARINSYPTDNIIDRAVSVTPSTFNTESSNSLVAIDSVSLDITEQDFKGQQPDQNAFVLITDVSANDAHLIALTYHVTVLTPLTTTGRPPTLVPPTPLQLDVDDTVDINSL